MIDARGIFKLVFIQGHVKTKNIIFISVPEKSFFSILISLLIIYAYSTNDLIKS